MGRLLAAAITRAARVLLVSMSLLAGCAMLPDTQSVSGPRAFDPVRLLNAIVADDAGYVRGVVSSGAASVNQHIPAPVYMEGTPLITIAARSASLNVLRYLISAGADVNARTPAGETPLMLAAYFKDQDTQDGSSYERHESAVRLLVTSGSGLENEAHNYTPLAYAAYQGRERTVRYLLERGASVDADASNGTIYVNTPLMMACIMGHMDTALILLKAGANPRVRVKEGMTAREFAIKYRHSGLARTLACAEGTAPGEAFSGKCL